MTPEVKRQVGNEKTGGYKFTARAPCLDGSLSDLQVMERWLDHRKGTCPCVKEKK